MFKLLFIFIITSIVHQSETANVLPNCKPVKRSDVELKELPILFYFDFDSKKISDESIEKALSMIKYIACEVPNEFGVEFDIAASVISGDKVKRTRYNYDDFEIGVDKLKDSWVKNDSTTDVCTQFKKTLQNNRDRFFIYQRVELIWILNSESGCDYQKELESLNLGPEFHLNVISFSSKEKGRIKNFLLVNHDAIEPDNATKDAKVKGMAKEFFNQMGAHKILDENWVPPYYPPTIRNDPPPPPPPKRDLYFVKVILACLVTYMAILFPIQWYYLYGNARQYFNPRYRPGDLFGWRNWED